MLVYCATVNTSVQRNLVWTTGVKQWIPLLNFFLLVWSTVSWAMLMGDGASPEEVQKKVMSHLGLRQLLDGMDELLVRVCNKFRYSVIKDENLRVALTARCLVDAELTVAVAGRSYRYFPRHLSNLFGSICKEEFDVLVGDRLEKNRKTWELQYGFELFEAAKRQLYHIQQGPDGCGH